MKLAIIIPFYGRYDLTHARLYEIYRLLPRDIIEVFLVDDASPDKDTAEIQGSIKWWQEDVKDFTVRYYRNKENLGFGGAMNTGAKLADRRGADIFVFHSNDVKVSGDFTKVLIDTANNYEKVLIGNEMIDYPAGWNEFEIDGKKLIVPWLNGFWLACKRNDWKELGGFDPLYGKYTYEDLDLCTHAVELGFSVVSMKSPFLHHMGAATTGYTPERQKITEQNREKYFAKWKDKLVDIYKK